MAGFRFSRFGASVALAALALAGCNRAAPDAQALLNNQSAAAAALPDLPATLPMTDAPAPPVTTAPRVAALPDARPIRAVRVRDAGSGAEYAYADAAYQFADALGEAPPDYGFDYDGVEPWAWQGYDDSVVFAEPVSGGYRTYYYRPGADEPYFVRDPYYSYGYDDGQLAVVYAPDGAVVPWADYGPQVIYASRYLVRGRDLWRASQERRIAISAQGWADRRAGWFEARQQWGAARARQPVWSNYAPQDAAAQSHWQGEQARRAADTRRFATWQAQSFRSSPPPRAIPPQWQQASWARDPHRFAPAAAAVAGGAAIAGGVMAHNAQIAAQRQQALAMRQQQQARQAQLADTARIQQEQARQQHAFAEHPQPAMRQQPADAGQMRQQAARLQQQQAREAEMNQRHAQQQQARAADMAHREQANAVRAQQQQARAAEMNQHRAQQAARMEQQQRARAADTARREQAGAARAQEMRAHAEQQQQARAAAMSQRREQQAGRMEQQQQAHAADMARREHAGAARAQEMQARAQQQQQAHAAQAAERAQMQAARAQEQRAAPRPAAPPHPSAPPRHGPERPR